MEPSYSLPVPVTKPDYVVYAFRAQGQDDHLLKQASKPVPQIRKRRKIDAKGTFEEYLTAREESKHEESQVDVAD